MTKTTTGLWVSRTNKTFYETLIHEQNICGRIDLVEKLLIEMDLYLWLNELETVLRG